MHASVEIVTPAQAKELMERNRGNRKLSERTVWRYASDMKAGFWNNNGQGIVIAANGDLLDGQHRLKAIVYAGVPIAMLVVRGVDPASFITMDTGKARRLPDVLSIQGHTYTTACAGIARAAYNYVAGVTQQYNPSVSTLAAFITQHPYIVELAKFIGPTVRRFPKSPLGAVLVLGNERQSLSDEVKGFVEGIQFGEGLWKGDPRLTLREWFAAQHDQQGRTTGETTFAATARAWNAYAAGKELTVLRQLKRPTIQSLPIYGFDRITYHDVPDLVERRIETARSNFKRKTPKPLQMAPVVEAKTLEPVT